MFSEFQTWALSLKVPALQLPALAEPTQRELHDRWYALAMEFRGDCTDTDLATTLCAFGTLNYLEDEHVGTKD
jgi:hypothetical protein